MAKNKKDIGFGIKALGEKDVVIGLALLILGGILATAQASSGVMWFVASVLTIFGVILAGFGISNYLRK